MKKIQMTQPCIRSRRRKRRALLEFCGLVLGVACLYLTHTCTGGWLSMCGLTASPSNGVTSEQSAESSGSIACGLASIEADALLPRPHDNDPYLAFLALVSMQPLQAAPFERQARLTPGAVSPAATAPPCDSPPLRRLLAHASHVLC